MSFLKRAWLAVTRQKGKAIVILIILLAIANMVLSGFAINTATDNAKGAIRQKLGATITIRYNIQNARSQQQPQTNSGERVSFSPIRSEPVSLSELEKIIHLENIMGYNYNTNGSAYARDFEPVTDSEEEEEESGEENGLQIGRGNFSISASFDAMADVGVYGTLYSALLDAFQDGSCVLLEGRHLTADDTGTKNILIETNLAQLNEISVGDVIKLATSALPDEEDENYEDYVDVYEEFTVVGIYESSEENNSPGRGMGISLPAMDPYNRVYMNYEAAMDYVMMNYGEDVEPGVESAVLYVTDPLHVDGVLEAIESSGFDTEKYMVDANNSAYEAMEKPIESTAAFARTALLVVSIAGALILTLVLILFVKERMYETGVLLSMGETKMKVILQYLGEVVIIAVLAFAIAVPTGSVVAQKMGDVLLAGETEQAQEENNSTSQGTQMMGGGMVMNGNMRGTPFSTFGRGQDVEYLDALEVNISIKEITYMVLAGFAIILASIAASASLIMRYNPKTILTKVR